MIDPDQLISRRPTRAARLWRWVADDALRVALVESLVLAVLVGGGFWVLSEQRDDERLAQQVVQLFP